MAPTETDRPPTPQLGHINIWRGDVLIASIALGHAIDSDLLKPGDKIVVVTDGVPIGNTFSTPPDHRNFQCSNDE